MKRRNFFRIALGAAVAAAAGIGGATKGFKVYPHIKTSNRLAGTVRAYNGEWVWISREQPNGGFFCDSFCPHSMTEVYRKEYMRLALIHDCAEAKEAA